MQHIVAACEAQVPTIASVSSVLEGLLEREDLVDESVYTVPPGVEDALQTLRCSGMKLAIMANTKFPF